MLIFVIGLAGMLYKFYSEMNVHSAHTIARSEAQRIAKEIDNTIGFRGLGSSRTILLNRVLKVGKNKVNYALDIDENSVIITLKSYPHQNVKGIAAFGLGKFDSKNDDKISCTSTDLMKTIELKVEKTDSFIWIGASSDEDSKNLYCGKNKNVERSCLCNEIKITMTAEGCIDKQIKLTGRFPARGHKCYND
jgi:hypothetical protein